MHDHGGQLRQAAARYGVPLADWLDLSTGINPNGWPVPELTASAWSRLPECDDELNAAARDYYGTGEILPVAGTQAAIQMLPSLFPSSRVSVLDPGYYEHARAWINAGHSVTKTSAADIETAVATSDIVVIIHPNNPTGARFAKNSLLEWSRQLASRGGWLIVDEAFIDTTPEQSLSPFCPQLGLIVLRSLGKFFGLAGARVGFVCAPRTLRESLDARLGPWHVSAPSRAVAIGALRDRRWQQAARAVLVNDGARLKQTLSRYRLDPAGGCALFQWTMTAQAETIHEQLARRGILTRRFAEPASLRFGLPGNEMQWKRLEAALATLPACVPQTVSA